MEKPEFRPDTQAVIDRINARIAERRAARQRPALDRLSAMVDERKAQTAKPQRRGGGGWWMKQAVRYGKEQAAAEQPKGQDAALPPGDRE